MGFIIRDDGLITLDHSINDYGITCPTKNPQTAIISDLSVHSVFSRKFKTPKRKEEKRGDNCPFVYAYKGKDPSLKIGYQCAKEASLACKEILRKFFNTPNQQFDLVIPMPSKHKLVFLLSRLIHDYQPEAHIRQDIFRKATYNDVNNAIDTPNIPRCAKKHIKAVIKRGRKSGTEFSLSNVKTHFRKYIPPLHLKPGIELGATPKVLLVDDLACTGQTLLEAKNALQQLNPHIVIQALALFGPHSGRFKPSR